MFWFIMMFTVQLPKTTFVPRTCYCICHFEHVEPRRFRLEQIISHAHVLMSRSRVRPSDSPVSISLESDWVSHLSECEWKRKCRVVTRQEANQSTKLCWIWISRGTSGGDNSLWTSACWRPPAWPCFDTNLREPEPSTSITAGDTQTYTRWYWS